MAQCQMCRGRRVKRWYVGPTSPEMQILEFPCPECGGSGIEHCCEGLREQLRLTPMRLPLRHTFLTALPATDHPADVILQM
jgi:hypothetical protein